MLGLMAAVSNGKPFGLLCMKPLQWWLKTKGFPLGQGLGSDHGWSSLLAFNFLVMIAQGVHPWAPDSGSRHPVEAGAEAREMETPPNGHDVVSDSVAFLLKNK